MIGPAIQKIVVGEVEKAHHTLTRFFALHAGVSTAMLIGPVVIHIYLLRKHEIRKRTKAQKRFYFWPDQILKDAIACLTVLLAVLGLTIYFQGAPLGPPADPNNKLSCTPRMVFPLSFSTA